MSIRGSLAAYSLTPTLPLMTPCIRPPGILVTLFCDALSQVPWHFWQDTATAAGARRCIPALRSTWDSVMGARVSRGLVLWGQRCHNT